MSDEALELHVPWWVAGRPGKQVSLNTKPHTWFASFSYYQEATFKVITVHLSAHRIVKGFAHPQPWGDLAQPFRDRVFKEIEESSTIEEAYLWREGGCKWDCVSDGETE